MSNLAPQPSETVDTTEAAHLLKTHVKTVTDLIRTGEISAARIGKGYVMMRREVLELIERRIESETAKRTGIPLTHATRRTTGALARSRALIASMPPPDRLGSDVSALV